MTFEGLITSNLIFANPCFKVSEKHINMTTGNVPFSLKHVLILKLEFVLKHIYYKLVNQLVKPFCSVLIFYIFVVI